MNGSRIPRPPSTHPFLEINDFKEHTWREYPASGRRLTAPVRTPCIRLGSDPVKGFF